MMTRWIPWAAGVLVTGLLSAAQAAPITALYYTSSPASWVGQGETITVTPADGFAFNVSRNFDNGVSFWINDFLTNPDFQQQRWWFVDFSAPFDATLLVGFYDHATRWPFQEPENPGLDFGGNGRGNNALTGFFEVLEALYADDGSVLRFAADFTQFDEGIAAWWNRGSIRFNSDIPLRTAQIPEPATGLVLLSALIAAGWLRSGRTRRYDAPDLSPSVRQRSTVRYSRSCLADR